MIRISNFVVAAAGAILLIALFLSLGEVFAGRWIINPVAFTVGLVDVRWYGIFIAAGILIALEWTMRRAKVRGLDLTVVERATFAAILGGIAGARLIYVAQNLGYFTEHTNRIVALTDGGLSIHGALLGGAFGLWLAVKASHAKSTSQPPHSTGSGQAFAKGEVRIPIFRSEGRGEIVGVGQTFLRIADAAIPGLLLAMILGRLGNFANAELYGPPTDLPWKLFVPVSSRPDGLVDVAFYHPTFLYDMILNGLLLVGLLWAERRWRGAPPPPRHRRGDPGALTLWFFLGIAITRLVVEFWRLGDSVAFGLSLAQLVSLVIAGAASVTLIVLNRSGNTTASA